MPKVTINDDSKYIALIQAALVLKGHNLADYKIGWYSKFEDDTKTVLMARVTPVKEIEDFDIKIEVE